MYLKIVANHLLENLVEFVAWDEAVLVDVVDLESKFQLFIFLTFDAEVREAFNEFIEVYFSVIIWRKWFGIIE